MGLLVLDQVGVAALLYNLVVDLFALMGTFYVLAFFFDELKSDQLDALRGMLGRAVPECICLVLFLLCLIGLPPLPGFIGKFALIGAVVRHQWPVLATIAILSMTLSTVAVARLAYHLIGDFAVRKSLGSLAVGDRSKPQRQSFFCSHFWFRCSWWESSPSMCWTGRASRSALFCGSSRLSQERGYKGPHGLHPGASDLDVGRRSAIGGSGVLVVSPICWPRLPNPRKKDQPFECGVPAIGDARHRFSVRFYLVAILFLLFDVEAIFFFPWAVVYKEYLSVNSFILVEMAFFVAILAGGLRLRAAQRARWSGNKWRDSS